MLGGRDPAQALIREGDHDVTVGEFLARAARIGASLTAGTPVLNLCERRPAFLAAYAAALQAGCTTLLPASRAAEVLDELRGRYPGCVTLDDAEGAAHGAAAGPPPPRSPAVAGELVAMIGFTSGSTGAPSRHEKRWRVVAASTAHNAARLRAALPPAAAGSLPWIVGTVPSQHMYGMELTVLLPLLGGMAIHGARPLLPADVAAALADVPEPRILVSTPAHLRAIVAACIPLPPVAVTVCATAPLDAALALAVERATGGALVEMFGSTETCILGSRRTASEPGWTPYPGVVFAADETGTEVRAPWFGQPERLQDFIETGADGRFALRGRSADLVEVAGKRASLAELTQRVLDVPGVSDAVVFQPETSVGLVRRLAAVVVARGLTTDDLRAALAPAIDPVFMPRPLLLVAALPRTAAGKLPRAVLTELLAANSRVSASEGSLTDG